MTEKNMHLAGSERAVLRTGSIVSYTTLFQFFDLRLLFLVTALVTQTRARMVHQLHGLTYLMEVLDLLLERDTPGTTVPRLTAPNVALAVEILKILFNLTITVDKNNLDEVGIEDRAITFRLKYKPLSKNPGL